MTKDAVLLAIENISACAQSTDPKRDWKASHDAICKIYRLAHTANAVDCRKNHPKWTKEAAKECAGIAP